MRQRLYKFLFGLSSAALLATACSAATETGTDDGGSLPDVKTHDVVLKFAQDSAPIGDDAVDDSIDNSTDASGAMTDTADDAAVDSWELDTGADDVVVPADVACQPACGIHLCGDDGCGGSCGACPAQNICSVGKCITDPTLGCAGLSLPPNWAGTFSGDMTFSILGLIPTKTTSKGNLSFAIKCLNSKFLVNGAMSGTASKLNPFTLKISGTYDPTTKKVDATMSDGDVTVFLVVEYFFGGTIGGTLDATNTFSGTWTMATTSMKLLGSATAGQIVPLTGNGTWTATGGP